MMTKNLLFLDKWQKCGPTGENLGFKESVTKLPPQKATSESHLRKPPPVWVLSARTPLIPFVVRGFVDSGVGAAVIFSLDKFRIEARNSPRISTALWDRVRFRGSTASGGNSATPSNTRRPP